MSIREQVMAFHKKFDVPIRDVPEIPSSDEIRLRLALVFEEAFEMAEALGFSPSVMHETMAELFAWTPDPSVVDMIKFVDACGDVDYVVEGARQVFGVNGKPIADEIQRSNMAKHKEKNSMGKITKPPGWTPPNIEKLLREQGWKG